MNCAATGIAMLASAPLCAGTGPYCIGAGSRGANFQGEASAIDTGAGIEPHAIDSCDGKPGLPQQFIHRFSPSAAGPCAGGCR
jgi:hypothetical protein